MYSSNLFVHHRFHRNRPYPWQFLTSRVLHWCSLFSILRFLLLYLVFFCSNSQALLSNPVSPLFLLMSSLVAPCTTPCL
jgi:hypothetical protein